MKKYSRWILILSALLCLCVLFASCQTGDPVATEPATEPQDTGNETEATNPPAEEPIPSNEQVDYKKLVDKWSEYLEFKAPTYEDTVITKDKILEIKEGDTLDGYGYGFRVVSSLSYATSGVGEAAIITCTHKYDIYNIYTGAKIGNTLTTKTAMRYGDSDFSFAVADYPDRYSFAARGCIFELTVSKWVKPTEEDPYGYYTDSYLYFDSTGAALNEEPVEIREDIISNTEGDETGTFSVLDRAYYVYRGQIVKTFKAGQEILLPTPEIEYKDRGYVIHDEKGIYVYNADREIIAKLDVNGTYDRQSVNILANGNVLVEGIHLLPDNAEEYTVEVGDEKYDIEYLLLDVNTGKTVSVEPTFIIDTLVTPREDDGTKLAPKGEYQYAAVYKITDGKADEQLSYVILDNEWKISAELPKILKDQTDLYGALNGKAWVVETDEKWLYTVELESGKVALHADLYDYTDLEGGFICNNALYNYKLEKLLDFTDYVDRTWVGGRIFVRENYDFDSWKLIGINENGELVNVHFGVLPYYSSTGGIERFVLDNTWYTLDGNWLMGGDSMRVVGPLSDRVIVSVYVDGVETYYTVRNEKGR